MGIGADCDGITTVVEGLEDVSTYPALFAGHIARLLPRERRPSKATIEELVGPVS